MALSSITPALLYGMRPGGFVCFVLSEEYVKAKHIKHIHQRKKDKHNDNDGAFTEHLVLAK
jgi:hypothetical protein